jgi:uncharacterized membrane protein (DUF485 family)
MAHGPVTEWGDDKSAAYKARLGIYYAIIYSVVYSVFVALNVVTPQIMSIIIIAGLNLAVVYGIGLIVLAIVMGLIYNHMCTKKEDAMNEIQEGQP